MNLELKGKVFQVSDEQTGTSANGVWKKRQFVVETEGDFAKKVCFQLWGDKCDDLNMFKAGDAMRVFFNLESREFNSKWYTDAKAWKIEMVSANSITEAPASKPADNRFDPNMDPSFLEKDDLPF